MPIDQLRRLLGGYHRHDLEVAQVAPHQHPFLDRAGVVAFHQLEAAAEIGLDPGADIFQPRGHHAPLLLEALVERLWIVAVEMLDNHEQHAASPGRLWARGGRQRCALASSRSWFSSLHKLSRSLRSRPKSRA